MDKRLARRFAAFYFLLFLPIGMQAPYLFLFFKRQGFTDTQLGTLAAQAQYGWVHSIDFGPFAAVAVDEVSEHIAQCS